MASEQVSEEWFDVVDDNDHVVGRRRRADVHRLNLLHRAAHILVFNHDGQLFLQKRSAQKDNSPGLWDSSAAGHLSAGEDYVIAAQRELAEELGIASAPVLEPLFKVKACRESEYEFAWVYRCLAEGPFLLDPVEVEDGCWLAPEEVSAWLAAQPDELGPTFRLIWRRVLDEVLL